MQIRKLINPKEKRECVFLVQAESASGDFRPLKILIDTGAQANLVSEALYPPAEFRETARPVVLRGVNNTIVKGGTKEMTLRLHFKMEKGAESLPAVFYNAADIGVDAILGYPWLKRNGIIFDMPNHELRYLGIHGEILSLRSFTQRELFYTRPLNVVTTQETGWENKILTIADLEGDEDEKFLVCKLTSKGRIPKKQTIGAAGFDLYSAVNVTIPPHSRKVILTDIAIRPPVGTYTRIAPRSGLSLKKSIDVGAGVIDRDYTGNIGVVLINQGKTNFDVCVGDRVAQLLLKKHDMPEPTEVASLPDTDRATAGFGSTGEKDFFKEGRVQELQDDICEIKIVDESDWLDETWPQETTLTREEVLEISKIGAYALTFSSLIEVEAPKEAVSERDEELKKKVHEKWDNKVLCTQIRPDPPEEALAGMQK